MATNKNTQGMQRTQAVLEPERQNTSDGQIEPDESTSTKTVEEEFPDTTKVTYTPKIFSIENNGGTLNYGY